MFTKIKILSVNLWAFMCVLCSYGWAKTRNYISKRFELGYLVATKKYYELIYYDGGCRYISRFPNKRGPIKILTVYDDTNSNVTAQILEFMGPAHNFHGVATTPILLGYKTLKFNMINGEVIEYTGNDVIKI